MELNKVRISALYLRISLLRLNQLLVTQCNLKKIFSEPLPVMDCELPRTEARPNPLLFFSPVQKPPGTGLGMHGLFWYLPGFFS